MLWLVIKLPERQVINQDFDILCYSRQQACLRHPLGPQQPTITWFAIAGD
ncbi:hypothetical protein T11_14231 [Trichinella zimbabwensis]|uniref:Uncharacterized protein n=1 Tax=Trichinella zimbabwensis TaxID=268475 RepID=A0A0V1GQE6_9BILA|nr:hypothetical protein T11_14231 [Trichinella zimbabwensis]